MKTFAFLLLLTLTFFLLPTSQATAQDKEDVVYLKDGSTIRGELVESNDLEVKIMIQGGSVLVYKSSEVDKIVKEPSLNPKARNSRERERFVKQKGYLCEFHIGSLIGQTGDQSNGIGIGLVNGYQFSQKLGFGLGVQYAGFQDIELLPVYAALRYQPSLQSPFVLGINSGYGIPISEVDENLEVEQQGGWYFNPEIAAHLGSTYNFSWMLAVGYFRAPISFSYQDPWSGSHILEERTIHRLSVKAGIRF